ncbi:hypothetical protein [Endozoicomonas atrinae]
MLKCWLLAAHNPDYHRLLKGVSIDDKQGKPSWKLNLGFVGQ